MAGLEFGIVVGGDEVLADVEAEVTLGDVASSGLVAAVAGEIKEAAHVAGDNSRIGLGAGIQHLVNRFLR